MARISPMILDLPFEITSSIFLHGLGSKFSQTYNKTTFYLLTISSVNAQWRDVALNTAQLWCSIVWMPPADDSPDVFRRVKDRISAYLYRSQTASIDISYHAIGPLPSNRRDIWALIIPHLPRCQSLTISLSTLQASTTGSEMDFASYMNGSIPLPGNTPSPEIMGTGGTPEAHLNLLRDPSNLLPRLKTFSLIVNPAPQSSAVGLLRPLLHAPNLRELTIHNVNEDEISLLCNSHLRRDSALGVRSDPIMYTHPPTLPPSQPFSLSHVNTLSITTDHYLSFSLYLETPRLKELLIQGTTETAEFRRATGSAIRVSECLELLHLSHCSQWGGFPTTRIHQFLGLHYTVKRLEVFDENMGLILLQWLTPDEQSHKQSSGLLPPDGSAQGSTSTAASGSGSQAIALLLPQLDRFTFETDSDAAALSQYRDTIVDQVLESRPGLTITLLFTNPMRSHDQKSMDMLTSKFGTRIEWREEC
ncbi:hypothetical protein DL93DRAFT_1858786 [Clavulina sp. PMI_390]|nr:hypothetical protein DL93DRAFT_1858786 [Clavulina sp. PMI_390]